MILEKHIQSEIKIRLEASGWLVIKLIQTTLNGVPDLLALRNNEAVFIEVKRPGAKTSPLQNFRIKQIQEKSFQVIIANKTSDISHLCNHN